MADRMSGHKVYFEKIALSAHFFHDGGQLTMSSYGKANFSEAL